ncbi:hypothetical protein MBLNU13_g02558t1 [Cladosporium sp. NU13]
MARAGPLSDLVNSYILSFLGVVVFGDTKYYYYEEPNNHSIYGLNLSSALLTDKFEAPSEVQRAGDFRSTGTSRSTNSPSSSRDIDKNRLESALWLYCNTVLI